MRRAIGRALTARSAAVRVFCTGAAGHHSC